MYWEVILNEEGMWIGDVPKVDGREVSIKELKNEVPNLTDYELSKLVNLFEQTGQDRKLYVVRTEKNKRSDLANGTIKGDSKEDLRR